MKRMNVRQARSAIKAMLMTSAMLTTMVAGQSSAHQPPGAEGAPEGFVRANVLHGGDTEAIRAVILDAPRPAIMVNYQGEEMLTVFDSDNQPFLRFHHDRVEANPQSRYWTSLPQSKGSAPDAGQAWVRVSGSGSFGWVDPRLSEERIKTPDSTVEWRIPVRQEQKPMAAITGQLSWRPLPTTADSTHP
ncbi:hypothetical protein EHN06_03120 [Marinobacter sp. NP-4(2019)]|uniref:hypothetical protein n=1 Tax=Marinobacter sp. NP-4(2019) TaxID=2488665 RepID=UPI000FC3EF2D|nr:hypothetical protein [Marinobacter sp. NP-4(2019)]AZT82612.1 hypothetical protein EHN06_03120 [Marinobacter sp. NP-4(2019)]